MRWLSTRGWTLTSQSTDLHRPRNHPTSQNQVRFPQTNQRCCEVQLRRNSESEGAFGGIGDEGRTKR